MMNFEISYHNVEIDFIKKKLENNKKKINEINQIITKLVSLKISQRTNDLSEIRNTAKELLKNKHVFVVLGTGGSNLGARALISILQNKIEKKIYFFDNIDPVSFSNSILKFDINRTGFIIISKSGFTLETLSQFTSIIEIIKSENNSDKLFKDFVIITENNNNPLRRIGEKFTCTILDHDSQIGGRYSAFSNVGLLPACIAGLDIEKIRKGASEILFQIENTNFKAHFVGATLFMHLQLTKSINSNVLMTYSDALYFFGKWYLQLWSESIGKNNKGITPLHAVGTTDQHSQLQLYLDGPKDKFFSLLTTDHKRKGLKLNEEILRENNVDFLVGKTMGDLMHAEQQATLNTLITNKLPVREIYFNQIDEYTLGQLMAYCMVETIATCLLMDVDPFNQPAVDQGKRLIKNYLSN